MLMWGVIWGHTITCLLNGSPNEVGIHPLFRTYDMPFFMLISGFFLSVSSKRYSTRNHLLRKITTIALPTIVWTLASSKFQSVISSYYFLWAVFWSSVIVIVVNSLILSCKPQVSVFALIIVLLHVQPYSLYNLPYLFPYFILGYYCYGWLVSRLKIVFFILPLCVTGLCYWDTSYTIWNAGANIIGEGGFVLSAILYRTFMACTGIVVSMAFFDMLYDYVDKSHHRISNFVVRLGRETLALYIVHPIILGHIIKKLCSVMSQHIGYNVFAENHLLLGYVIAPVLSIVLMYMMLLLFDWCHNHRFTNKLFGFKVSI